MYKVSTPLSTNMKQKWKARSRKLARQMFWEEHNRERYECPDCGRRETDLLNTFEVHHKDEQSMNNQPENHIALCRPCHNLREGKKPSIKEIRNLRNSLRCDKENKKTESEPPSDNVEDEWFSLIGDANPSDTETDWLF